MTPVAKERLKIRILLADDHAILREGVAAILNLEPDMEVVAQAATGRMAVNLYREYRPDVGLIDLEMPDGDGAEAISLIREFDAKARLMVLTVYSGEEDVYRSMSAGAKGYLLKSETPKIMTDSIRVIADGGRYLPPEIARKLADRLPREALSTRELEVLRLLVAGNSNSEIGLKLDISESTVKFHMNHVLAKLGVADRTQAVVTALRNGLVRLS